MAWLTDLSEGYNKNDELFLDMLKYFVFCDPMKFTGNVVLKNLREAYYSFLLRRVFVERNLLMNYVFYALFLTKNFQNLQPMSC